MSMRSRAAVEDVLAVEQEPIPQDDDDFYWAPARPTGACEALEVHLTYEAQATEAERRPWAPKGHTHHKAPKEEEPAAEAGGGDQETSALKSFLSKRKKKKASNLGEDLVLLQYLFTNRQSGLVETRGLTRTVFKSIFGQTDEWEFAHSKQGQKGTRERKENEAGMLMDDMFAVLDKERKGFISLNNVLQFMFKHKHKDQIAQLKKLVTAREGVAAGDPGAIELPTLPSERVEELQEIFRTYCTNGSLNEDEFRAALASKWQVAPTPSEIRKYFAMADTRKRGFISQRDFIEVVQNVAFVHFEDINKGVEHRYRSRSSSTSTDPTGSKVHLAMDPALQMLATPKNRRKEARALGQVPPTPTSAAVRQALSRSTSATEEALAAELSLSGSQMPSRSSLDSAVPVWDTPQRPVWRSTGGGYRVPDVSGMADLSALRPSSQNLAVRPQWSRSSERKRPATGGVVRSGFGREEGLGMAGLGRGRGEWATVQAESSGLSKVHAERSGLSKVHTESSGLSKEDVRPNVLVRASSVSKIQARGGSTPEPFKKPARDPGIDWASLGIVRNTVLHPIK